MYWTDATALVDVLIVQEGNTVENRFQPADSYAYGFGHGMNDYYQPQPVSLDLLSCVECHLVWCTLLVDDCKVWWRCDSVHQVTEAV